MGSPLGDWICLQGKHVRVDSAVDPVSDRSSASCGSADRTIYVTRAIAQGDVLVELRDGAFLNGSTWLSRYAETTLSNEHAAQLREQIKTLQPSGTVVTALALLAEKARGASGAFHGYIQQLPTKVSLPLAWSPAGKAMLQDTAAFPIMDDDLVKSVFDRFATPLTTTFPNLWLQTGVSFDDFCWAFSIVSSRAFSVSDAREPTLLPVIDMANHEPSNPAAVIRKDDNSGSYSLVALRAIDADTPVTISYGDLSNAQLLCRYGFTLPDVTPFDSVLFSSTQVRAVFAQLASGGSVDGALAQLDRFTEEEAVAHVTGANEKAPAAAAGHDDSGSQEPAVKRRKLFDGGAHDEPAISFALHGDAAQDFGLADGLMGFVLANDLPMDALYDVLSVLLQFKDKRLSAQLLAAAPEDHAADSGEAGQARSLAAREREVCRRILLGIMSLEEDSEEEEEDEGEQDEDEDADA